MQRTIMTVFGTRPEAIKMMPVVKALEASSDFRSVVVVTAQHREMLDQVLEDFDLHPDYDFNLMKSGQTLTDITNRVLSEMAKVIPEVQPEMVLVHGDTSTTMAAALAAFYQQIPVGHVEAGLRTWQKYDPFPEEMNRQITDDLATLYFAPTDQSKQNLLLEHHPEKQIVVTGNTAIDALQYTVTQDFKHPVLAQIKNPDAKLLLVTMHRRENQGEPMRRALTAIKEVVAAQPDVEVIFPAHLSPRVQKVAHEVFDGVERVHIIDPLEVIDFHNLAARSYLILTDSGGVQEEAPSLGKPVLVLRDTTERPEGVTAGTLRLVGTDPQVIKTQLTALLTNKVRYQQMTTAPNPYGDGHAAERILEALTEYLGGK